MKKLLWTFLSLLLLFTACNKEEEIKHQAEKEVNLYALKYVDSPTQQGAALKYKLWEPGQTIKIKFLNGTATNQARIQDFAAEWMEYANITFEYVTSGDADVKIGFKYGGDNVTWSYIGTDAQAIAQNQPTMNFGGFISAAASTRRDVLMMFGHMLGLVNEHQSLGAEIPWDVPVVYEYYMDYEGWTEAEVNNFFFQPYSSAISNYTEYDPLSIMVWPIEDFLTTDGLGMSGNNVLSDMDKEFIAQLYPTEAIVTMKTSKQEVSFSLTSGVSSTSAYTIDWGDGSVEYISTYSAYKYTVAHSYTNTDEHTIKIFGDTDALHEINCKQNQLTFLDVSKNSSLSWLECQQNQLTSLDVTKNSNLTYLYCGYNNLKDIDLSKNINLHLLNCSGYMEIENIDISNNVNLSVLVISQSSISTIDVSNNTKLREFHLGLSQITSLDISNNHDLMLLEFSWTNISTIDISNNPLLRSINFFSTNVESIDISNNQNLKWLKFYDTPLYNNQTALINFIQSLPDRSGIERGEISQVDAMQAGWISSICAAKNWSLI